VKDPSKLDISLSELTNTSSLSRMRSMSGPWRHYSIRPREDATYLNICSVVVVVVHIHPPNKHRLLITFRLFIVSILNTFYG